MGLPVWARPSACGSGSGAARARGREPVEPCGLARAAWPPLRGGALRASLRPLAQPPWGGECQELRLRRAAESLSAADAATAPN